MTESEFFFSCTIDLQHHSFTDDAKKAMYATYSACKALNQPNKYGRSVYIIQIIAVLQDHESRFFKPFIRYWASKKTISARVHVDAKQLHCNDFMSMTKIYQNAILKVLDTVKDRVKDYDFESLKQDLDMAINEQLKVTPQYVLASSTGRHVLVNFAAFSALLIDQFDNTSSRNARCPFSCFTMAFSTSMFKMGTER